MCLFRSRSSCSVLQRTHDHYPSTTLMHAHRITRFVRSLNTLCRVSKYVSCSSASRNLVCCPGVRVGDSKTEASSAVGTGDATGAGATVLMLTSAAGG